MAAFVENAGLLVMLAIAVAAVMRFRARRYLLVLMVGIAVGAWLTGYIFGARSTATSLYAFIPPDRVAEARMVAEADLPNPLWGLAFVALIILVDLVVFRVDLRKISRNGGGGLGASDTDPQASGSGRMADQA